MEHAQWKYVNPLIMKEEILHDIIINSFKYTYYLKPSFHYNKTGFKEAK